MICNNPHKSQAGRKPCDVVRMFKILAPGWLGWAVPLRCGRLKLLYLKCYILGVYSLERLEFGGGLAVSTGSVFVNNRTQAVRLPADARFPDEVKQVSVRVVGKDRILSPMENTWDSFFLSEERVGDDFMEERASQEQSEREGF